jgi:ribosomal protein S18 acetylase RimI-like enzyme
MAIITLTSASATHPYLRRFDPQRDLNRVADLVEQCFADTLDADGRRYIQQMRATARSPRLLRWAQRMTEHTSFPLSGFVWEQDEQIVGNLSILPFSFRGKRGYLIANVAVHPTYRRRGIARAMTEAALQTARKRRAQTVWLHVRTDNPPAIQLYQRMGFVERLRRTQWVSWRTGMHPLPPQVSVLPRQRRHWPQQREWFNRLHPPEIGWYLSLPMGALRPGIWGFLYRFFAEVHLRQWAAMAGKRLLGVLTWQRTYASADRLWLAAPTESEEVAVRALLPFARRRLSPHRSLRLEYPAGRAAQALQSVGFTPQQTLIWMTWP